MPIPKIVYPSGGGTTLIFAFPPVNVKAHNDKAVRHDTVMSGGKRQSLLERSEEFLELDMTLVPEGTDAAKGEVDAWKAWWDAIKDGTNFDFFPDKDLGGNTTYITEDTEFEPELMVRGPVRSFEFELRWRKQV